MGDKMDKSFFRAECNRFKQIASEHGALCREQFAKMQSEVVCVKYGVGGECFHRGYYCPSMVSDIVVGNCNRGRLYNNYPKTATPTYIYGFNAEHKLVTVEKFDTAKVDELIVRQNGRELGFRFSERWGIEEISECTYSDGRLKTYSTCVYHEYDGTISEFCSEVYEYDKDRLTVHWYRYIPKPSSKINKVKESLFHDAFIFELEDNMLKSYTTETYVDGEAAPRQNPDRVYQVRQKRRIDRLVTL